MADPAIPTPPPDPAPSARVPFVDKLLFSSGGGVQQFASTAPHYLANPIFNLALGMNPVLIGIVLAVARLWDALTDPLVGNISDNVTTRWGRRRPFMVAGSIMMGLSFAAMWWLPRGAGETFYFGYFLFTILSFYLGVTFFTVPWNALGIEMTDDYNERTSLFAYAGVTHKLVGFTTGWLYPLAQLAVFQNVLTGVRVVGCLCGTLLIVLCIVPALRLKEPARPAALARRKSEPFLQAMRVILSNRVLLVFSAASLLTMTSLTTVSSLGLYVNIYHIYHGDKVAAAVMMGWWGTVFNFLAMVSIPLVTWTTRRLGKHRTMMLGLGIATLAEVSKYVLYTPAAPALQLSVALLLAPGLSAYYILVSAMGADIVDYDEWLSGRRREGLIAAANMWITKMGISLSFILAGVVLSISGFDADHTLQSSSTVFWMRVNFCAIPAVGMAVALLLFRGYPLTRQRVEEIQAELPRRRALAAAAGHAA
jgi:GPH family glycoside/pentoside/hexuronide:cation symporter